MNVTELADLAGVTKGAISQVVSKLEKKGAVRRYKSEGNEKEVLVELTDKGREIYERHQKVNEETISHLLAEMTKHQEDKVEFLVYMFKWFEDYLDEGRKRMEAHKGEEH
jgi:DNA-binding MarR family transcriptional regulator